ncbi:transposase (plasmid) [Aneurinibacillus sp. Ricciae_BoGa-3]|uniref:RNA-guided endonuclease InsQ/TnpB family protein n=1 Tax=Aneurinibacillus sp. Ricciae_BoGa-3 TaxID=3022697 RepID=UPI002340E50D|nr:transposase [Aneurinibacillus sp. Ricciae_BoGa-3]WCK57573.1 transposase [Aneurinibacillus sp. Ricciae_BoGa-3]
MYRGQKIYFSASPRTIQQLFECNRISADIWNDCLVEAKNYFFTYKKWIKKSEIQKHLKGKYRLHSQSIQAVAHKYLDARDSTYKAIQKGIKTARYPYKKKKHFNTKWVDKAFSISENGTISLSLGVFHGKRVPPLVLHAKHLPKGDIKEIELCYDNGLYLSVSYEDGQEEQPYEKGFSCAVDMGEIHTIASFCENGESILVSGRKMRSLHRLRNKKIGELQKRQSHCKKGSRQWKKYQRAKRYIISKSEHQLRDALHKTTKSFVDWCIQQKISDIYVGNPEGVQRKTKKKKRKKTNQKLSNWSFGKTKDYLKYKGNTQGIKVFFVSEAYSSQTCPVCKRKKKVSTRNYRCHCGYTSHRDVHGAKNILSESLRGSFEPWEVEGLPTYLRPA